MSWFNSAEYLNRIQYQSDVRPSLATLKALQRAHLLSVPFENLDIHNGVEIKLDIKRIYEKIVLNHRGGFCYEANGLFYELLVALGFTTQRISARVFGEKQVYGPEYDHLAILVDLPEGRFLTDVGFGDFSLNPLKLELGLLQTDPCGLFMMDQYNGYLRFQKKEEGKWIPQYIFTETARDFHEFEQMCHYMQVHPDSHFRKQRMITRATPDGRITLTDKKLKRTIDGHIEEILIPNLEAFNEALGQYF